MAWRCDVCLSEIEVPRVVCHHCGKVLCTGQGGCSRRRPDEGFGKAVPVTAWHCPDCTTKYHSDTARKRSR